MLISVMRLEHHRADVVSLTRTLISTDAHRFVDYALIGTYGGAWRVSQTDDGIAVQNECSRESRGYRQSR
jgi:hypothetical protein